MDTIQSPTDTPAAELPRPIYLICSRCCNRTRGRQHWNFVTGYGVCLPCVEWMARHGTRPAELARNYGTRGVHYDVADV